MDILASSHPNEPASRPPAAASAAVSATVRAPAALFLGLPCPGTPAFDALCDFCDEHRVAVLASLPWVAAEIAGHDGFDAMLRFVRALGGRRVYVPRDRSGFADRLGVELSATTHARLLAHTSEAGTVEVPSAWGVFIALRRIAIRAAMAAGGDLRSVAQSFGVSERHLRCR
ncbi:MULTISPECIES: hypothetical protein [unclassified Lysobacter]|uniref:hypothetical protein n=1 Tax=unclassified Lysobacter TaxID=2635362 RepID=UPI0006FC7700|nr:MULTISPECIES: hypothetical protein [unclassified Lysobacter]KRA17027.1 hypothetical protein ASD69_09840 [Lysobacter sp. Root604]KRD73555.1 hypothetical protein ASE43_18280 [Lysobacter sp. Root983]